MEVSRVLVNTTEYGWTSLTVHPGQERDRRQSRVFASLHIVDNATIEVADEAYSLLDHESETWVSSSHVALSQWGYRV